MQIRALFLLPELPFTRVGSCCTHVTSCCTRVVSCCLVLYSCYLIFALALSRVVSCFTCVVRMLCHVVLCCYSCSFLDCNHHHNILRLLDILPNFHHKWNNPRLLFMHMVYSYAYESSSIKIQFITLYLKLVNR